MKNSKFMALYESKKSTLTESSKVTAEELFAVLKEYQFVHSPEDNAPINDKLKALVGDLDFDQIVDILDGTEALKQWSLDYYGEEADDSMAADIASDIEATLEEGITEDIEQVEESRFAPSNYGAPLYYVAANGSFNLRTGRTKYFNIFDDNTETDSGIITILKKKLPYQYGIEEVKIKGKPYVLIAGAGDESSANQRAQKDIEEYGTKTILLSKQGRVSQSQEFEYEDSVGYGPNEEHKTIQDAAEHIRSTYGYNSLPSYVYK